MICPTCGMRVPVGNDETDADFIDAWAHLITHEPTHSGGAA